MAITLITGVPGTGKTAFVVSELEKIAATGRIIFVDNIPGLKVEHYRAGKITDWQKGTWLHIDEYKRTTSVQVIGDGKINEDESNEDDGNENWIPRPGIVKDESGDHHSLVLDAYQRPIGSVPYETHKGAILIIDEAQRHFRPRPAGSAVPDHVAALEVHRHQGLDVWLITQRPGLVDANVRALCGKHIALRATPFGRYKYEWPEVGDIESKTSRDTAARSRYRLPRHVFELYKSAEAHVKHRHTLPLAAKILLIAIPLAVFFFWSSYQMISGKFGTKKEQATKNQTGSPLQSKLNLSSDSTSRIEPVVEDWRIAGIFELSSYPVFVLKNKQGEMRRLFKPRTYMLNGFDSTVELPEGGTVTYYTSFKDTYNRGK